MSEANFSKSKKTFEIKDYSFNQTAINSLATNDRLENNWPVVDLLNQVLRIYRVLLSRAIKGVYIYACDEELRNYLSKYFDVV